MNKKSLIMPRVFSKRDQMTMGASALANEIGELGCPFTVVWATNKSNLLQGTGFIACDETGVSILIQRFERDENYRPSQEPKPFISWSGSLEYFLRGICSQENPNGYSAVISFVRQNHPYPLVAFRADAIIKKRGRFAPLAEIILKQ